MNSKMKILSLAVLGLVGIGAAGSAMAVCPVNPFAAWDGGAPVAFQGTVAGNNTGMLSTACKMAAQFAASAPSNGAQAVVIDNTPANETQYRFRFYVNTNNVNTGIDGTKTVTLFRANSAAPANNETKIVNVQLRGASGSPFLRVSGACTAAGAGTTQSGFSCRSTDVALPAGDTRVEGQVTLGAAGAINIWIGSNVNSAAPDKVINLNNAAWVGVKQAVLGLSIGSSFFKTSYPATDVFFDEFDSRRQTFIGN